VSSGSSGPANYGFTEDQLAGSQSKLQAYKHQGGVTDFLIIINDLVATVYSECADTLLHQLYWSLVQLCIEFKMASLCCKTFHATQPSYLAPMLIPYRPIRLLRSSIAGQLAMPPQFVNFAAR
jgi:hypothetical protein